jgi:hypothetical protein
MEEERLEVLGFFLFFLLLFSFSNGDQVLVHDARPVLFLILSPNSNTSDHLICQCIPFLGLDLCIFPEDILKLFPHAPTVLFMILKTTTSLT